MGVIKRLHSFMLFLNTQYDKLLSSDDEKISWFIDIDKSIENNDSLRNDFVLFNHFKDILELYNEEAMNPITMYARINNIGVNISEIFTKSGDDKLVYNKNLCIKDTSDMNISETKFIEVFDKKLKTSQDLSIYMTLAASLNKHKNTSIVTYGYSGTGKTYTLFGKVDEKNSGNNVNGILQSTLTGIHEMEEIEVRVFELYGKGIPYYFYWHNDTKRHNIEHKLYAYNIKKEWRNGKYILVPEHVYEYKSSEIEKYMKNPESFTMKINKHDMKYFDDFSETVNSIDKIRKENERIVSTPNNPESSRSIIIYDFKIQINKNPVTFLIIDLPGRENIEETYITPYLDNPVIKDILGVSSDENKLNRLKMIITCMVLNPMGLAVFDHDTIIKHTKNKITNNFLNNHSINNKGNKLYDIIRYNNDTFNTDATLNLIIGEASTEKKLEQRKKILAVFLMYDLIENRDFNTIETIYTEIINNEINKKIDEIHDTDIDNYRERLITTGFKDIKDRQKIYIAELDEKRQHETIVPNIFTNNNMFRNFIKFHYIKTQFEGIYINENITGIVKYLSMVSGTQDKKKMEDIYKQNDTLDKDTQRNIARSWIGSTYWFGSKYFNLKHIEENIQICESKSKSGKKNCETDIRSLKERQQLVVNNGDKMKILRDSFGIEDNSSYLKQCKFLFNDNYEYNYEELVNQRNLLIESYIPERIFNFENPIIEDVLNEYMTKHSTRKIKNFKFFYLFGNYERDDHRTSNCKEQAKLLEKTREFINFATNPSYVSYE